MMARRRMTRVLRALDAEEIQLDSEARELLQMCEMIRALRSDAPNLDKKSREKIWQDVMTKAPDDGGLSKRERYRYRVSVGLAAALALIIAALMAFVFIPSQKSGNDEGQAIASLQLSQGEIKLLSAKQEERQAGDGDAIRNGDCIIASPETRAIVEYDSGSIMRLEGETEAVVSTDGGKIRTEVKRGKSYHRVIDGTNYAVTSRGVKVEADGTAFTFEIDGNTEKVVSLESSLKVEIIAGSQSGWRSEIREGESFSYHEGGEEPQLAEVYPQDLDTEWLRWNRNLDKKLGLPLGVLAQVAEDDAGKGQADAESQGTPSAEDQSAPVASLPGQEENTPSSRPATPPRNAEKTLTLLAESNDSQVSFTWNISGYSGFQGFKLFRSETNPAPASPNDWWKYIDGQETRAAVDDKVESCHTYYYRLGVYDHGDILGYSNSVQVTVKGQPQEPDILLTGIQAAGKVDLCWSVSEAAAYEGFKVLRSETNSMPSYPEDWIAYVTEAMTYTDTNIKSGGTYYYRIGIYRDGAIIKYSNAIKVIVP